MLNLCNVLQPALNADSADYCKTQIVSLGRFSVLSAEKTHASTLCVLDFSLVVTVDLCYFDVNVTYSI